MGVVVDYLGEGAALRFVQIQRGCQIWLKSEDFYLNNQIHINHKHGVKHTVGLWLGPNHLAGCDVTFQGPCMVWSINFDGPVHWAVIDLQAHIIRHIFKYIHFFVILMVPRFGWMPVNGVHILWKVWKPESSTPL